jgi:hypothetical protein
MTDSTRKEIENEPRPIGEVSGNDWSMAVLYSDNEPGASVYSADTVAALTECAEKAEREAAHYKAVMLADSTEAEKMLLARVEKVERERDDYKFGQETSANLLIAANERIRELKARWDSLPRGDVSKLGARPPLRTDEEGGDMSKCNWCDAQTNEYHDYSIGGLGNFVYYCPDHQKEADAQNDEYVARERRKLEIEREVEDKYQAKNFNDSFDELLRMLRWEFSRMTHKYERAANSSVVRGKRVLELEAEVAALREFKVDGERLDYLESRDSWDISPSDHPDHEGELFYVLSSIEGCINDREYKKRGGGYTLRAAIDAARGAVKKEGE